MGQKKLKITFEGHGLAIDGDKTGKEWKVTIIKAGTSQNGRYYPLNVLHRDYAVFEGVPVYVSLDKDHDKDSRGVLSTAGFVKDVHPTAEGIAGTIHISLPHVRELLLDWHQEEVLENMAGLSIVAGILAHRVNGIDHIDEIVKGESVDIVKRPAAGGKFEEILESTEEDTKMFCEACGKLKEQCACGSSTAAETLTLTREEVAKMMREAATAAITEASSIFTQSAEDAAARISLEEADAMKDGKCPCGTDGCKGCSSGRKKAQEMGMMPKRSGEGAGSQDGNQDNGKATTTTESTDPPTTTAPPAMDPEFLKMIQDSHLQGIIAESKLPEHSADRVRKMFDTTVQIDMAKVREAVKDEKDYLAATHKEVVENLSDDRIINATVLADDRDKKIARIDAMFDKRYRGEYETAEGKKVNVGAYMTFSEAFCDWTGMHPHRVSGNDIWRIFAASTSHFDSSSLEVREGHIYANEASGGTAARRLYTQPYGTTGDRDGSTVQWGSVIADRMYRSMVRNYYSLSYFEKWQQLVKFVPAKDFREIKRIKIGWFSDLPEVSQGAQYQDVVMPEDELTSFSVRKYGMHAAGISREMMIDDDIGVINEIPMKMAKAAAHTIYTTIFKTVLEGGDAAYRYYNPDGVNTALFSAANGNFLDDAALTGGALDQVMIKMRQQKIFNEPEPTRYDDAGRGTNAAPRSVDPYYLGEDNMPKFMVVNTKNWGQADRLTKPDRTIRMEIPGLQGLRDGDGNVIDPSKDGTIMDNPTRFNNLEVIVVDDFLESTQGIFMADPYSVEGLVFSFLNGQQHPDIIVQSDPQVGDNFNKDLQTFKIRHEWGVGITDHRPFFMIKS